MSTKRRTLKTYGERGRSARVFLERGGTMVRVQWRVHGQLKTSSFPNTTPGKEAAKAFATACTPRDRTAASARKPCS